MGPVLLLSNKLMLPPFLAKIKYPAAKYEMAGNNMQWATQHRQLFYSAAGIPTANAVQNASKRRLNITPQSTSLNYVFKGEYKMMQFNSNHIPSNKAEYSKVIAYWVINSKS
ncbi:hypothetical protein AVEN_114310-1 [Araneus ventricosus]|uniref:Uncharacterized protein n=1 Tax=Araneus ventricosus TaxID=182803 RepID=A0A4Y2X2Z9_ARAVE|nr:hypothetical protein AVEN_114310-1 [Araneus ventricosus]